LQALAAVLHICDITFEPKDEGCAVTTPTKVELVANLLQVGKDELLSCLTTENMVTKGKRELLAMMNMHKTKGRP